MMKKRIAFLVAMVLVFSLTLIGCTPTATEPTESKNAEGTQASAVVGEKKTIGVVQINFTNPYYIGANEAFQKAADNLGYELILQSAENSIENEIAIIENYIEMGVDCIIADPQDAAALVDVFKQAADAGIVTIALRSPVDTGGKNYNCLINHYLGFRAVTYAAAEALDGKGKILLMQGQIGHEASDSRQKGFDEAIANYPDIELLDSQPCDWDPTKAQAVVDNWLIQYGEIDAILSMTDGATPPIVNAVEAAGRQDEILIVGNDGEKAMLEAMVDGKVVAEAFFASQRDAYNSMVYADAILKGYDVPKTVYLPLILVCDKALQEKIRENVGEDKIELGMATAEEALSMLENYVDEFTGYYDKYAK